jgi:predicted nucleic acid-binding protein
LRAPAIKHRITADYQRGSTLLDQTCNSLIDFAFAGGLLVAAQEGDRDPRESERHRPALERDGGIDQRAVTHALDRLRQLATGWHEVDPSDTIREAAVRFLRVHPLRAADALQLAAAFIAAERRPSSLDVVTLDERLALAARKEGFALVEIAAAE